MKFEVKWTANNQVIESDYVNSLNNSGAEAQVVSMRGNMPGFRVIGVYAVNETRDFSSYQTSNNDNDNVDRSDSPYELSGTIATFGILGGFVLMLFGLFSMPSGIIAFFIGGFVGWLGWKIGTWLADRGW